MSRVWGGTAFAKRSEALKAPVELLSGSAVCDSRWRGVAPTSATPTKITWKTRKSLRSEVPDSPCSTRGQEPSTSIGGSFCFAGALRDGVVYSAQFNNSEFVEENMQGERKNVDTTICANMSGNFILYAFRYG